MDPPTIYEHADSKKYCQHYKTRTPEAKEKKQTYKDM